MTLVFQSVISDVFIMVSSTVNSICILVTFAMLKKWILDSCHTALQSEEAFNQDYPDFKEM